MKVPVKKLEWSPEHSVVFEDNKKKTGANIAKLNYYDPAKETQLKCTKYTFGRMGSSRGQVSNHGKTNEVHSRVRLTKQS